MAALTLVILLLWAVAFACLWRIPDGRGRSGVSTPGAVSVIIPARDEADRIPQLLASLRDQGPVVNEIIVVDDGSTDGTGEIAREAGATVVRAGELPPGWRGKTWACRQGAAAASGDLLLFVDADTWFAPHALERLLAFRRPGAALSVVPYHAVRRPYEQLSAFFNLLMVAGVGAFSILGRRSRRHGMFGQFLLVERRTYESTGGHEPVRGEILENLCLADVYRRAGIPIQCAGGRGTFLVRMYPHGIGELVEGWSKAFVRGAGRTSPWVLGLLIAWIFGAAGVAGLVAAGFVLPARYPLPLALTLALYAAFAVQIHCFLRRIGSYRWLTAALYPIPLVFYFAVFGRALLRAELKQDVQWKGRRVSAREEEAGS